MNTQLRCVGKEVQLLNVKLGGTYSTHYASHGLLLCALSHCVDKVWVYDKLTAACNGPEVNKRKIFLRIIQRHYTKT